MTQKPAQSPMQQTKPEKARSFARRIPVPVYVMPALAVSHNKFVTLSENTPVFEVAENPNGGCFLWDDANQKRDSAQLQVDPEHGDSQKVRSFNTCLVISSLENACEHHQPTLVAYSTGKILKISNKLIITQPLMAPKQPC